MGFLKSSVCVFFFFFFFFVYPFLLGKLRSDTVTRLVNLVDTVIAHYWSYFLFLFDWVPAC